MVGDYAISAWFALDQRLGNECPVFAWKCIESPYNYYDLRLLRTCMTVVSDLAL